jgi:cytochrome c5
VTGLKYFAFVSITLGVYGCGGEQESGQLEPSQTPSANTATAAPSGKQVYQNFCSSCHTPGLNAAPRIGDVAAWAPRIAKGEALLLQATIEGVPPAMPPMGMCFRCTQAELAAAVSFMVQQSR